MYQIRCHLSQKHTTNYSRGVLLLAMVRSCARSRHCAWDNKVIFLIKVSLHGKRRLSENVATVHKGRGAPTAVPLESATKKDILRIVIPAPLRNLASISILQTENVIQTAVFITPAFALCLHGNVAVVALPAVLASTYPSVAEEVARSMAVAVVRTAICQQRTIVPAHRIQNGVVLAHRSLTRVQFWSFK